MLEGTVNSVQAEKGFGFIKPKEPGPDVFFHYKTLQRVKIDTLEHGQPVWYEIDSASERPRASAVSLNGKATTRDTDRGQRSERPQFKGHVTNIKRRTREGFISPTEGGKEVVFTADAVWDRAFNALEAGQFVEYTLKDNVVDDQGRSIAFKVIPTERHVTHSVPKLGRHPNARKKKPSWRG